MIDRLGWYSTRTGFLVKITRIFKFQLIAEGILHKGDKKSEHVWNTNGFFDRHKETDLDIVEFKWEDHDDWHGAD